MNPSQPCRDAPTDRPSPGAEVEGRQLLFHLLFGVWPGSHDAEVLMAMGHELSSHGTERRVGLKEWKAGQPCQIQVSDGAESVARMQGTDGDPVPLQRGYLACAVPDIYAAYARLQEHGVTINYPPRDGQVAFVRPPDSNSIELQVGDTPAPAEPWSSTPKVGRWQRQRYPYDSTFFPRLTPSGPSPH